MPGTYIDFSALQRKFRANYMILEKALKPSFFGELPEHVIPTGYPWVGDDRNHVRQRCFDHRIYPPVHWVLKNVVPETFKASHSLSSRIMTIPCDYRYNEDDMQRVVDVLTA